MVLCYLHPNQTSTRNGAIHWNIDLHFVDRCKNLDFKLSPCSLCSMFSFWVIPRRLSSKNQRFGTLYQFHLHRQVDEE